MSWNEHMIARAISLQTFSKKCVLLVDNCNWTGYECDVLGVTNELRIIDIEIKISRSDLKADAKKDKWWHRRFTGYMPREEVFDEKGRLLRINEKATWHSDALDHPRMVWKHYYALPKDIWNPDLINCLPSQSSGVLLLKKQQSDQYPIAVECVRRAKPNKDAALLKLGQVMDIARLANLRMWEARKRDFDASKKSLEAVIE